MMLIAMTIRGDCHPGEVYSATAENGLNPDHQAAGLLRMDEANNDVVAARGFFQVDVTVVPLLPLAVDFDIGSGQ